MNAKYSVLLLALMLAACGGGGGGSSVPVPLPVPTPTPSTPPTPTTGQGLQLVADSSVEAGKTASASVLPTGALIDDVVWTQVGGPAVELLAARSPTVAFESSTPGVVRLRADVRLADGSSTTATADVTFTAAHAGSAITVRADHAVRPATDTSVRAWPTLASGDHVGKISWTQVAGTPVTMDTSDQLLLMFKSPAATAATTLRFRATLTTTLGQTDQDEVTIAIDPGQPAASGALFDGVARVHPYRTPSTYANVLQKCVYDSGIYYRDNGANNLCTAATLPLLQTEAGVGAVPSVAQIMGRVLVSHDFLGANLEQFLLTQDPNGDFRRLLAGTSAIVLGSHVRPSYYYAGTGAIYLDANYLWLTPAQRDVVSEVPDYRLAFDDALSYTTLARQVKNNAYARRFFYSDERNTRTVDELIFAIGRVMYHELGHASDFFEPTKRALNLSQSIFANVAGRIDADALPSDALRLAYPLQSAEMKGLGQVLYYGATPTAVQKAYTASQVGAFFAADRASDDYAYSITGDGSTREDLAMLFEEFMMSYRHGVQYDLAFTNLYTDDTPDSQIIVGWGERGRIAEPAIKPRIKLVLQRIAPWIDPAAVDSLPAPVLMHAGQSWSGNLVLGATLAKQSSKQVLTAAQRREQLRDERKKPLH
jgi:hypothetical protein